MEKTFTTFEILNITAWYKQAREEEKKPLNSLPLSIQWQLKKNIAKIQPFADDFLTFRDECDNNLREEFTTDEKSFIDKDENGNDVRKIKDEFLDVFRTRSEEVNKKLNEILMEENTVEISTINLDELVEKLGDDEKTITIEDIDMLSFMSE